METSQKPNHSDNIVHTLMIGHKNDWDSFGYAVYIFKMVSCTNKISAFQQKKVQIIDTFFMRLIAKKIQTNPLNRMENHQRKSKT